jgi:NRPS condensation-like uncharacterized protein
MKKHITGGFRLSPQQRHLWLLQQVDDHIPYRAQAAVLIEGNFNREIFETALAHVCNRYEILRTTFHCAPGMTIPVQVINDSSASLISTHHLCGLDRREQSTRLDELFLTEQKRPFDLEQGPILRVSLVMLSSDKQVLLVSLPTLCADSITLKQVIHEIAHSYHSKI